MNIEHLFPTTIGYEFCPFHTDIEKKLVDHCNSFSDKYNNKESFLNNGQLFTTFQKHNLLQDKQFDKLNKWVVDKIREYMKQTTMSYDMKFEGEAFFNIYNKHDYQEEHNHFGFVISCIYFLKANNKASKVFFRPHVFDNIKYDNFTYSPSTPVFYEAQPGKLLIFRSYIDHFVEQHLDEEQRISLAYNFR